MRHFHQGMSNMCEVYGNRAHWPHPVHHSVYGHTCVWTLPYAYTVFTSTTVHTWRQNTLKVLEKMGGSAHW